MALTAIDKAARPVAKSVIDTFGRAVTFTVNSSVAYSPTTGLVSAGSNASHTVNAVIEESRKTSSRGKSQYSSVTASAGETENVKVFTISGYNLGFEPVEGMSVTIDSDKYVVSEVAGTYSGQEVAIYQITALK